jgi:hypothetical protein
MTEPAPSEFFPEAALVSFLDFPGKAGEWELRWNIKMKNGDTILLRQVENIFIITTYNYTPEDAPMGTIEELQLLVDKISKDNSIGAKDRVYLHLPPVTYEGGLVIDKRPINLVGSEDEAGNRTTFTDTVRVAARENWMSYINDVDFIGGGKELAVSGSARLHLTGCTISGWKTGALAYNQGCINLDECLVEDNEIGFHFNSPSGLISDNVYENNIFRNNTTAVLLENIPSKEPLKFTGTRFSNNGTDIDNRCEQQPDISEAIFD